VKCTTTQAANAASSYQYNKAKKCVPEVLLEVAALATNDAEPGAFPAAAENFRWTNWSRA